MTCLILLGGFVRGRLKRSDPDQKHPYEVGTMMIRDGWGSSNPVFRHFFTTTFIPDAPPEIAASFDELQRIATSPAAALRLWTMTSNIDVVELAKRIKVPTLVLHCAGDRVFEASRLAEREAAQGRAARGSTPADWPACDRRGLPGPGPWLPWRVAPAPR